ncbi:hypothetical protein [Hyphomicrobium sp.]|uniref:hypothetical protein n=1 Tax=Hyphomicrobium sp. TaxID=82 RepID=UPI0025BB970D|nr:hypothetical protein [Hyphomicrobium sp.]MCC7251757.1 hypothetical protein [Hyphomicrobium sp.]
MSERHRIQRRPTVTAPGAAPRSPLLAWLKRECIALFALSGAALTVLAQLANVMPVAPQLSLVLARWQELIYTLWRPPLDLVGIGVHPHIIAALNVSAFMALLGVGARISARLAGKPLEPIRAGRFFDDQTWPSMLVFAALCIIFLLDSGGLDEASALIVMGSKEIGKYAFAVLVTVGYFAGDFIGHREFHLRLYRLAVIVALLAAANLAIVHFSGSAG